MAKLTSKHWRHLSFRWWKELVPNKLVVVADCVRVNHCAMVRREYEKAGIEIIYPSNGFPHNIPGGYPPYSHDLSILDGSMFGVFQARVTKSTFKKLDNLNAPFHKHHRRHKILFDTITEVWNTERFLKVAEKCLDNYPNILRDIRKRQGPTYRYINMKLIF